jgi:hypothetical protein
VILLFLAAVPAVGLGRRVAGGVLGEWFGVDIGAIAARAFFGMTCASAAIAASVVRWQGLALIPGAVWWHALALIPCILLGCSVGNYGSISMGRRRVPGTYELAFTWRNYARDFAMITVHGLGNLSLAIAGAWWLGYYWPALIAGALAIGPAYSVAWLHPVPVVGLGRNVTPFLHPDPPETAEFLWGSAVGVGVLAAVVLA